MSSVSRCLGANEGRIDFEGREFTLAPLTYDLQAKFETWLERRAVEAVRRQKSYLDADEYRDKMAVIDRDIAAGVYSFGGEVCVKASRSLPGVKELLRLSLQKNHPADVDYDLIDRLVEAKLKDAADELNRVNADPLSKTPPAPAGG